MKDSHLVAHHIRLLNGRIFQKLLSQDPEALYRSEQIGRASCRERVSSPV